MRNRWMIIACVAALAACGNDNNENNGSNNTANSSSNNANNTSNNGPSNNGSNNTTSNNPNNPTTGENNTSGNNPTRTEPFITRFSYFIEDDSIGSNEGFRVSVVSGDIANLDGNTRSMTDEDATAFEETHMTADTIDKMRNGWGCRDVTGGDDMGTGADMGADAGGTIEPDANHFFEARIQDEGDVTPSVQDITGCVLDNDPDVMALIEAVEELGQTYLQ